MHLMTVLRELPLSLLIISLAFAAAVPAQSIGLTPDNFKETIEHGSWFVEFYSPWCQHCRKLAPKWKEMEEKATQEVPSVKIAQVDCAAHGDLCTENGVESYPTMYMYQEGKKVEEYDGNRSVDDLMTFVKRFAQDSSSAEKDQSSAGDVPETDMNLAIKLTPDNFKDSVAKGVWFVEHFSPYCYHCQQFAPTWRKFVDDAKQDSLSVKMAQIDCVAHGDLCASNDIKVYPSLIIFKDGERVEKYNGNREIDDLKSFVKRFAENTEGVSSRPIINPTGDVLNLNDRTFPSTLQNGPTFVKFFAPWCGHCKKLAPIWKNLANSMQHKMTIAEVNCDDNKALCQSEKINGYPTLIYYANGVRSEYNGGRKLDQLIAFAERASEAGLHKLEHVDDLDKIVADEEVVYVFANPTSDTHAADLVRKASGPLLGSPIIYESSSPSLFTRFDIPLSNPWALISLKDHDSQIPSSIFLGSSKHSDKLNTWLLSHRLPTTLELTQDTFQTVMKAPQAPLVVIAASTPENQDALSERLVELGRKWRSKTNGSGLVNGREIVFTWMNADRWKNWMKSMYGIKLGNQPDGLDHVQVVIADHDQLIYYDSDRNGDKIKITSSKSVFSTVEDVAHGKLSCKYSENFIERLARNLNNKMTALEYYVINYPLRSVFLFLLSISVFFWVLFRLFGGVDERDNRQAKSSRLD